jgi:predicted helicase
LLIGPSSEPDGWGELSQVTTVYEVLDELRERYPDNRTRGDAFERLIRTYLRTDPLYAQRFREVWLWQDWPGREGQSDSGIDLVADDGEGGTVAIQCKFYDPAHTLQKSDIDSFFTRSGKAPFAERLIVSTTDKWSTHAEQALAGQQIPVSRIGLADLEASSVDWATFRFEAPEELRLAPKKSLRPHQRAALEDVFAGFEHHDRGKLIMACGTGKTFTALKIAEELAHRNGDRGAQVMFLVPSISLLNQTLREWTTEADVAMRSFAVCSDTKVGKRSEDFSAHDLAFPATTDPAVLARQVTESDDQVDLTVVFSTYQSIGTVAAAQASGLGEFDLVICDEAHRTTGVTLSGDDESAFLRVHDNEFLKAARRLYMTATPRLFNDETKEKAAEHDAVLCSMDDESLYGPEFHRLGFGHAVEAGLLTDYRVVVLQVDEGHVAESFQQQLADENNELNLDDAAKIIGCWNGLSKRGGTLIAGDGFGDNPLPMRRAVAFARDIKSSKALAAKFAALIGDYTDDHDDALACEVRHVDGTMNALQRNAELDWLKADPGENTCRILTNARCLAEGVDVPDLDAVLFLNPRNSVVDVVQSVGRVMRKAKDKDYGYIILPVGIPTGVDPATALRDNKRYKVVWQVLQALRAHDDRFNAMVNQIELNKRDPAQIDIIGIGARPGDDQIGGAPSNGTAEGGSGGDGQDGATPTQGMFHFSIEDWRDAIYARIVQKVGERTYWEQWADDIRAIAERHVARIKAIVATPGSAKADAFERFVEELRANLNPGISPDDAVEMLAQHLITKPVFDALFGSYEFSEHNPVSQTMQRMLDELDDQALGKEAETLESFYASVRARAEGVDNHEGRQAVITELYERFFKKALPKTADAFGIVYTPIEVVDFIIRAVEHALREHFDTTLSADGIHVIDPFTGTGTFIVRLLQSGFIKPQDLLRKYTSELHANEILLLAYYIAAINIEATFHQLHAGDYTPFEGIVLTDTFQLAEDTDSFDTALFPENHQRLARQKAADIRIVLGNPPYSVGQTSQNDANQNQSYPHLDKRIEETYVAASGAGLSRAMYDSYIRAFRWASDRIGETGIVCFVSNGGWIDSNSADGFRKALAQEYDHIYVFNLRGNQRTGGEQSRREGGKIFGAGSRNTVAITLLLRTGAGDPCQIRYADIGDYLSREEKLRVVSEASLERLEWTTISPNEHGDWLNQRDEDYSTYAAIGHKPRKGEPAPRTIFDLYSFGVVTNRDAWCWNFSRAGLATNITRLTSFYEAQRAAFESHAESLRGRARRKAVEEFVDNDPARISWTVNLKDALARGRTIQPDPHRIVLGAYRPFCKQALYFDRNLNERVSQLPRIFPEDGSKNVGFTLTGVSSHYEFAAIMTDAVPDLHLLDTGQFFPRYRYTEPATTTGEPSLLQPASTGPERIDNITPEAIEDFRATFGSTVTADDIFFYTYGLLHSPEYRERYAADLKRMLPRIPKVKAFTEYAEAGRRLSELHLGYESAEPYPLDESTSPLLGQASSDLYRVQKMRFGKGPGRTKDRTTIIYNPHITLSGIPEEAHRYMLGPKSAIEWVMDRYQVKTDKASGIVNDPNDWCVEVGDPRYIVDLVKRIVTVSLETMKIVDSLPALDVVE